MPGNPSKSQLLFTFLTLVSLFTASISLAQQRGTLAPYYNCNTDVSSITTIKLSKNSLTCHERDILALDLSRLKNMKFKNPSLEIMNLLQTKEISGKTLMTWLEQRIKYLYHKDRKNSAFRFADVVPIFNNKVLPFIDLNYDPQNNIGKTAAIMGQTNAENTGAEQYAESKVKNKVILFLDAEGEATLVDSTRVGLVSVQGLFTVGLYPNSDNVKAMINTIHRLSILFHEARHSDGAGRDLLFSHYACPPGHDYEGSQACDDTLNGSYTIGAVVLKEMLKNCGDCTSEEVDTEKMFLANQFSRVIEEIPAVESMTHMVTEMCQKMQTAKSENIDFSELGDKEYMTSLLRDCPAQIDRWRLPRKAKWVDPTPEYLKIPESEK